MKVNTGEPFKIIYSKARFPIRQRRLDGTFGCRGCGEPIPPKRKTWCSDECWKKYHPGSVIIEVRNRDGDICSECGLNCKKERAQWLQEKSRLIWPHTGLRPKPPIAEYDHIIPFSEGGLTVLENMRTLCTRCHNNRTAAWRKGRSQNKKVAIFG